MDILDDLTPAQTEAVRHMEGPLLVLAGAGSGKTRVITRRIAYLMREGVPPRQILAITFTNKAAGEMRERTLALVGSSRPPLVTTFHSFCARVLREYGPVVGVDPAFTIYGTAEQTAAIKRALAELNLDPTHYAPDRMADRISRAKNRLQRPGDLAARAGDYTARHAARLYETYARILRESSALDFDDLLMEVALGLRDHDEFREYLRDRFRMTLIDEYQDTNHAQYVIARDLAGERRNLCATGDPDQSIYGWRGAELSNILDFEQDFPDARVVRLEQNYRSTQTILAAASAVIRNNRDRRDKDLYTENPRGGPVTVVETDDEDAEAESIARRIRAMAGEGLAYGDVAVFVRTVAQTRAIEDAFNRARPPIAYEIVRGTSFYDRKEVRDVLAYLQVLHNARDEGSLRRIINSPARGIGAKTVEALASWAQQEGLTTLGATAHAADIADLGSRGRGAVARFHDLMGRLAAVPSEPIAALLETVITETGYAESLKRDEEGMERRANLDELVTLGANYDRQSVEEPDETRPPGLEGFLETVNLSSDQDGYDESAERVPVMTLHAAKGLEFAAVIIAGCEEGLLPHERSRESEKDLEEERRLFFVGMTRAKAHLVLTHARFRRRRGRLDRCVRSPFVAVIPVVTAAFDDETSGTRPSDFAEGRGYRAPGPKRAVRAETDKRTGLAKGELVRHPTYGLGRVVRFQTGGGRHMVRVRFNTVGEKLLDPELARLEKVAPA